MSSSWRREIGAVFRKEVQTELRSRSGIVTSGLFGLCAVITIAVATFSTKLNGEIAAGLLWVTILFSSVLALPRTFLLEEEQGTADLLRQFARPHAVFWGKALYNLLLNAVTATGLTLLFLVFTSMTVSVPWLLAANVLAGCAALTGAVTLCGALVARAANQAALAGAVSIPLLMPVLGMGVAGLRVALSSGILDAPSNAFAQSFYNGGVLWTVGLLGYAVTSLVLGPWLYAAVWKS
ncbi:MAG: heme exporter protein CcmB [Fimbriimonas sp.]